MLLKKIDVFGQQIGFEEGGSITYKTLHGAIFSLIVAIIGSITGFLFGSEIYKREQSISTFSKNLKNDSYIKLSESPLVFGVNYLNGTLLTNPGDYFDIYAERFEIDSQYKVLLTSLTLKQCTPKTLPPELKTMVCGLIPGCMCLDNDDKSLGFKNKFGNANSNTISVAYYPCNSSKRVCPKDIDSVLRGFYVSIGIKNSYVDVNNYNEPIKYYFENLVFLQSKDFYTRVRLSMTNNTLVSDRGWLLEDKVEYSYGQLLEYKSELMVYYPGVTSIGKFSFDSPNLVDKISRSYMKLQDLFAKVGGLINALMIIMKILTFHYIRFNYLLNIISLSNQEESIRNNFRKVKSSPINKPFPKKMITIANCNAKDNQDKIRDNYEGKDLSKVKINNLIKTSSLNSINNEKQENRYDMNYFKYVWYIIICKIKSESIYKQLALIQEKINISTMLKLINLFHLNNQEDGLKHQV